MCSKRGWRSEQAKEGNKTDKEAAGKTKKKLCPVADTQTAWFWWGMVSQKHLREAAIVTMATRRPDRQHVPSLLWLMPAARRELAMARHKQTHTHVHRESLTGDEPNWHSLCTDKWTARHPLNGAVHKVKHLYWLYFVQLFVLMYY